MTAVLIPSGVRTVSKAYPRTGAIPIYWRTRNIQGVSGISQSVIVSWFDRGVVLPDATVNDYRHPLITTDHYHRLMTAIDELTDIRDQEGHENRGRITTVYQDTPTTSPIPHFLTYHAAARFLGTGRSVLWNHTQGIHGPPLIPDAVTISGVPLFLTTTLTAWNATRSRIPGSRHA